MRGLQQVGTGSRNRKVAILGYKGQKRRIFLRKTSLETEKAEQWLLRGLQMRKNQGKCGEKWER